MEINEATPITPDKFDKRAQSFWEELYGLLRLLNSNTDKTIIQSVESNILTDYLLWRILNELKLLRETNKLTENANTWFNSTGKQ